MGVACQPERTAGAEAKGVIDRTFRSCAMPGPPALGLGMATSGGTVVPAPLRPVTPY
jgi:hypothetical protein